jgi:U4/U6 small nuclear ribonucleoprotein PRP31
VLETIDTARLFERQPTEKHSSRMSLADELLNDLDGLSDDEEAPQEKSDQAVPTSKVGDMGPPALPLNGKRKAEDEAVEDDEDDDLDNALGGNNGMDDADVGDEGSVSMSIGAGGVRPADELDREDVEGMDLKDVDDVESVVKLHKSKKLLDTLQVSFKRFFTCTRC